MRSLLLAILATSSFSALAVPYVGLEYGFGVTNHDFQPTVGIPPNTRTLDPDMEDGIFGGFVGYQLTDQLAVELGYHQFDLSDDQSSGERVTTAPLTEEDHWNSDIKAKSFSVVAAYSHMLNEKFMAKAKAGLTYTSYDATSGFFTEEENQLTDVDRIIVSRAGPSEKNNEIGGVISAGAEYFVIPQISVGANAKYQFDSFAQTASFNLGATYYFK